MFPQKCSGNITLSITFWVRSFQIKNVLRTLELTSSRRSNDVLITLWGRVFVSRDAPCWSVPGPRRRADLVRDDGTFPATRGSHERLVRVPQPFRQRRAPGGQQPLSLPPRPPGGAARVDHFTAPQRSRLLPRSVLFFHLFG